MIHRERAIATNTDQSSAGDLSRVDVSGLALFAIAFLAYTVVTLIK
jgi:hypothetical protein